MRTTAPNWSALAALPLLLALSLTGCASPLPSVNVPPPVTPRPPADLMAPPPSASYSESAQQRIRTWLERLTGSPVR